MTSNKFYYRLTNDYNGPAWALDVVNDNTQGTLQIARAGDFSGQYWNLSPFSVGSSKYRLTTLFRGMALALDIINDGTNDTPHLAPTGNFSGQAWTLTKVDAAGTTFRLSNDFTGPEKFLDVHPDRLRPRMASGNTTGTHWIFTLIRA